MTKDNVTADGPLTGVVPLKAIVITDPIRENAKATFDYFKREGVAIKVISGDNPATVAAIAKKAGLEGAENYIDMSTIQTKEELVKASIRYNCSHCEKYVLLSSHFIKPLSDYAHIKRIENIIAIGNPVTIPVYFEEWELKQKKKQLLYVGRMDYENKRVNRIVEAWKVLYEKYVDWELVLVGEGPYKSTLEEYIRRYDIQRVCFKGFQVSPPIQHYKEASIFLLTSDLEGFGLVVIESMSYGVVPVVYGSYEAIYDIIDNGKSGLITPILIIVKKAIDCISLLIENEELRKKSGKGSHVQSEMFYN